NHPSAKSERILAADVSEYEINEYLATEIPPVHDPFAGGGTIPLEAQRLGLRAIASDLNPVAVLINRALVEIPSRFSGQHPVNPGSQTGDPVPSGRRKATKRNQTSLGHDSRQWS